jgi:hypothetical protein
MTDRPITPPSEMVTEWVRMLEFLPDKQVFSEVAQWGADQELDACCEWIVQNCGQLHWWEIPVSLRAVRRPKPPSLKEQALKALEPIERSASAPVTTNKDSLALIRKALEALPND